jgi:hypothetical protein
MYCPHCSNQNLDNAKFCRACGMDLEVVALALGNKIAPPSAWLEKYGESKSKMITGAVLAAPSLLILLVLAFFVSDKLGLLVVWSSLLGWMAVWGIIKIATNAGEMAKARTMLNALGSSNPEPAAASLNAAPENRLPPRSIYDTDQLQSPPSVTEHTTKFLNKKDL